MKEFALAKDATGRFLGLFKVLVYAAFTYAGVEMIAAASGEVQDPRRNIPKAVHRVIYRILFFYVLVSLAISCLVPSNNQNLLGTNSADAPGAARSP
jgi:amino acid transporter